MSVVEAFKNLNVASAKDASDHETIYEVSYHYLSNVKNFNDLAAFRNCLVALINMDKYYKAVDLLKKVPEDISSEYPLEAAYVYYKVGDADRLEKVYKSVVGDQGTDVLSRALKHVLAQSLYQRGHVSESLKLYQDLLSSNDIDSELDLACNERAILYQSALKNEGVPQPFSSIDPANQTYDYVFNNGLIELAQGNTDKGLVLLNDAIELCNKQNADLPEEDLLLELAPIKIAIAYAHQTRGNTQEALQIFESIQAHYLSDGLIQLILKTNYASVLPGADNTNLTHRTLDLPHALHTLRSKLTRQQWQALVKNHLLLAYQADTLNKSSQYLSHGSLELFAEEFSGDLTPFIYKILVKLDISLEDLNDPELNKTVSKKVYNFVREELKSKKNSHIVIAGALLQVSLNRQAGSYDQSLQLLEEIAREELETSATTLHGAIFGALIRIYEALDAQKKLNELYESLVNNVLSRSESDLRESGDLYDFAKALAFKFLSLGDEEYSKKLLTKLSAAEPSDALVEAVLRENTEGLLPLDELTSKTDIDQLLEFNITEDTSAAYPVIKKAKITPGKVTKKTKKPKFSLNKTIKPDSEFNPEKDLDKERWLPMKLRSYYKPTKKERKKAGGHQGALETSSPAPTSSGGQSGNSKQKKKKKGKK